MKLGCIAREYVVNLYGSSSSVLNRGMETDRFICEWWIRSPRVKRALKLGTKRTIEEILSTRFPFRRTRQGRQRDAVIVEIPRDIQRIKREKPALARRWQRTVRRAMCTWLPRRYVATIFLPADVVPSPRYILVKKGKFWKP